MKREDRKYNKNETSKQFYLSLVGRMVRQESAKLFLVGSIPTRGSNFYEVRE